MTTERDVMELLGRANPVATDESAISDVRGRDFLDDISRSSTMTQLTEAPDTTGSGSRSRWVRPALAAAVAVAVVIGLIALAGRGDDPDGIRPASSVEQASTTTAVATTTPGPDVQAAATAAAVDLATTFVEAQNADSPIPIGTLLADDFVQTSTQGAPDPAGDTTGAAEMEISMATLQGQGAEFTDASCVPADADLASQIDRGIAISCEWEYASAVAVATGVEPTREAALIVVDDDEVAAFHWAFAIDEPSDEKSPESRFNEWMNTTHPEAAGEWLCCPPGTTAEEAAAAGERFAFWASEWADWLDRWACDATSDCTVPIERWVAEYDAQCLALAEPTVPTEATIAHMRLVPPPTEQGVERTLLQRRDDDVAGLDPADPAFVSGQAARLDSLIALGIDPACRPDPAGSPG